MNYQAGFTQVQFRSTDKEVKSNGDVIIQTFVEPRVFQS